MHNLRLNAATVMWYIIMCLMLVSCGEKPVRISLAERKALDSIISSSHNIDTISMIQKRMEREGNMLGSIIAYREMGKLMRNESRFDDALRMHSEGLKQAETLGDTLEVVQALNNIGTDYKRMGVLDMAQDYHYRAFNICKESTDSSYTAKKNRVVSLNGLGNIYLTFGNYARADSALRLALAGERELNSTLGQAINYANIGSIYRHREQLDSAWMYYRRSMGLNLQIGNTLGVALCHISFGSLYEKEHDYDKAISEYDTAYRQLQSSKDEWHAIGPLIALAGVYTTKGNDAKALEYLAKALHTARAIKSNEHLAEVYTLYYKLYKRTGNYNAALTAHENAAAMRDSVIDMEKLNRIQNAGLLIERNHQARVMHEANMNLKSERAARYIYSVVFTIVVVILISALVVFFYVQRIHRRNHLALKRLAEMRESFFTNITHEFRTPLTVILGYSHMLEEGKVPAGDIRKVGSMVSRQGSRLLSLINQLLDIQKVKSAIGQPDWHRGDVVLFISNIVEGYLNLAHSRGIRILYAPKQQNYVCDFVPDYAQKVVCNLVTNAIKFSKRGQNVLITLRIEDGMLTLVVADYGSGIAPEDRRLIFEPFYQSSTNKKSIGSGVGLALVKQIVSVLGGSLRLNTVLGKGSVFTVSVPVKAPEGVVVKTLDVKGTIPEEMLMSEVISPEEMDDMYCAENVVSAAADNADSADQRQLVLIVEDNRDVREYISMQLKDRYRLAMARDGKEGLRMATELVPDIIITDLMMPEMDGYELCQAVKQSAVLDHVPVIIVTAKTTQEDKLRGLQMGVDAYIYKPFNAEELAVSVGNLLEKHRLLRESYIQAAAEHKPDAAEALPAPDRAFLDRLDTVVYEMMAVSAISIDAVAEKLCMSTQQLRRKLNAVSGDTPAAYVRSLQMKKAKEMLDRNGDLPINEVAMACGYYDTSHFTRAFKQAMGVTPTQYKKTAK